MALDSENLKRLLPFTAVLAVGAISFVLLPLKAFESVTQELIALFGLMMAGVLPTMVLTASVMRAGNLSVKQLIEYRSALRSQIVLWVGLFLVALFASLLLVIGKMVSWEIPVSFPLGLIRLPDVNFDGVRIINGLVAMGIALVVFRAISVGNGVLALLQLSSELAISDAQSRDEVAHKRAEDAIKEMTERPRFGEYIDLKH